MGRMNLRGSFFYLSVLSFALFALGFSASNVGAQTRLAGKDPLDFEVRHPRSEIRKEIRNPKPESRNGGASPCRAF